MSDATVKFMSRFILKKAFLLVFLSACVCSAAELPAEQRARVVFVGDIMAHKEQVEAARSTGKTWNFTPQFRRVKPLFDDALVVGNLETTFAGEKVGFAGYPAFNTPDSLTDALTELGVDIVTLANNHILDRGTSGAARTIEVLNSGDILWTGISSGDIALHQSLAVDYAGLRWAFVSYSYGSNRILASSDIGLNTISNEAVLEGLAHARATSPDIIAVCMHWGNEYQYTPTKHQRAVAALCIENGADLVIGTHPHVLQPMEITSSDLGYRFTAYSLGNFVSYQRTLPRERSVILAVDVVKTSGDVKGRIERVSVAPTRVSVTRPHGRPLIEVVYAGKSARFNHAGLSVNELKTIQDAGNAVLEFLGAVGSSDAQGFYTLWNAASPDSLPEGKRKAPQ